VQIAAASDRFIFTVETTGALEPAAIVASALEVLQSKLADIEAKVQETGSV
jgi:hypothetical protein